MGWCRLLIQGTSRMKSRNMMKKLRHGSTCPTTHPCLLKLLIVTPGTYAIPEKNGRSKQRYPTQLKEVLQSHLSHSINDIFTHAGSKQVTCNELKLKGLWMVEKEILIKDIVNLKNVFTLVNEKDVSDKCKCPSISRWIYSTIARIYK